MEESELVVAYWRYHHLSSSAERSDRQAAAADQEAWDQVQSLAMDEAPGSDAAVVALFVALADAASDEMELAYLGAGPIEDYLTIRADPDIDLVDETARRHEPFRTALRSAWFEGALPPAEAERLRRFGPPL